MIFCYHDNMANKLIPLYRREELSRSKDLSCGSVSYWDKALYWTQCHCCFISNARDYYFALFCNACHKAAHLLNYDISLNYILPIHALDKGTLMCPKCKDDRHCFACCFLWWLLMLDQSNAHRQNSWRA